MKSTNDIPASWRPLRDEVNAYAAELFEDHVAHRPKAGKIFRDAVFGYLYFEPHEVLVIDCPLLQRLRHIHQTAFAHLVYFSARHSRFEHSLGVANLAGRLAEAARHDVNEADRRESDISEVRLAGLLHDCGHAMFSHLSESLLMQHHVARVRSIRSSRYFTEKPKIKMGEVLSFLLVQSDAFQSFWSSVSDMYPSLGIDINRVAWLIVGEAPDTEMYKADVITGPFDADKLDYFARDSHFTGIKAELDIERLLHTVTVFESPGNPTRLVMRKGSIPHLEQILFSKMMLYSSIYHHHKVRATECMVRSIFELIWRDPSAIHNERMQFQKITDFLRVSEGEFFVRASDEPRLRQQVDALLKRRLLKRALVFNAASMREAASSAPKTLAERRIAALRRFQSLAETANEQEIREIRETIHEQIPAVHQTEVENLWIDLPAALPLSEDAEQCKILIDPSEEPVSLRSLFPSDEWVAAYGDNKWTGHVFYVPSEAFRRSAGEAAMFVLRDSYPGIEFSDAAVEGCFK